MNVRRRSISYERNDGAGFLPYFREYAYYSPGDVRSLALSFIIDGEEIQRRGKCLDE